MKKLQGNSAAKKMDCFTAFAMTCFFVHNDTQLHNDVKLRNDDFFVPKLHN